MSREEFWRLSIRELFREFVVAKGRASDEIERDAVLAWQIANLSHADKMPNLKAYLAQLAKGPLIAHRQNAQTQKVVLEMLSAQSGFPLMKRAKPKKAKPRGE